MLNNLLKSASNTVRGFVNWIGNAGGDVKQFVTSTIDSFFGMLLEYLWHPIRDFLAGPVGVLDVIIDDLARLPAAIDSLANKISHRFNTLTDFVFQQLNTLTGVFNDLIATLPDRVLAIVVNGFLDIIGPIGDLLERYIVDHWDDPI